MVQTGLFMQLCCSFCLVWAQPRVKKKKKNHENKTIKSLIQGHLEIIFLKPHNKNNDLAR